MNRLARLGATTGAAVLALSLAAPADAARYVHHDASGDVVVERCTWTELAPEPSDTDPGTTDSGTTDSGTETSTDVPTEEEPEEECTEGRDSTFKEGDVTRVAIRHTLRRVVLRTSYRELTRSQGFRLLVGQIRTNEGVARDVTLFYERDFAPRGEVELTRPNGDTVRCDVGKTLDFTDNVIEIRIPRTCLSRPRWVKVGLGHVTMTFAESETGEESVMAIDDALRTSTSFESDLTWSPRIRRG